MIWEQEVQQGIDLQMLILQCAAVSTSPCCLIPDSFQLSSLLWNLPRHPQSTKFVSSTNILSGGIKAPGDMITCHFYFLLNSANSSSEWCQQLSGLSLNANHRESSNSNPAKSQANTAPRTLSTASSLDQLSLRVRQLKYSLGISQNKVLTRS